MEMLSGQLPSFEWSGPKNASIITVEELVVVDDVLDLPMEEQQTSCVATKVLDEAAPGKADTWRRQHKQLDQLTIRDGKHLRRPSRCPLGVNIYTDALKEFDKIRSAHRTLASTGCTPEFCQSGRAVRTFEPRVGRDRPLGEIQREAEDFLRECHDKGVIESEKKLDHRIKQARQQIAESAVETMTVDVNGQTQMQLAGGIWTQSRSELEYGVRASWRNSRRCIMRSEYEHLTLCDLRHITSSREMAHALIKEVQKAFNGGRILPTAFVFPPRLPGKRGPMLWNEQILAFAGYKQENGQVLGDPKNAELTEAMVELGWKPPVPKSRWDLLPLVTMAEGEQPYLTELPMELKRLVPITHPRYKKELTSLDLKWVMFPALSRLGFDIGGVQFTAAPFLGWFMDAEVGVRNLADGFRYNVLPDVVEALRLSDEPDVPLEDLPEYQQMAALSRAQVELNYAVYYSYLREHVMMIDTRTSSLEYMEFDDEYKAETGYRLPSDPYWLAPPQGSIVPLWHRGAAPNYQPKPMIAKHVQDPVKAWRRETPEHKVQVSSSIHSCHHSAEKRPKINIFSCSAGITAGKLARRSREVLERLFVGVPSPFEFVTVRPLNALSLKDVDPQDIILIIASTTGRGEVPNNALKFIQNHERMEPTAKAPRYSIYANGDSTYGDTYNAAARKIEELMKRLGCKNLLKGPFDGDTALQNPDWATFNHWLKTVEHILLGNKDKVDVSAGLMEFDKTSTLTEMSLATLVKVEQDAADGLLHVTLDVGKHQYQPMDHVKILVPNSDADVQHALDILGLKPEYQFEWHSCNARTFLSRYVDLRHTFKTLDWHEDIKDLKKEHRDVLNSQSVLEVLSGLRIRPDMKMLEQICKDMPSISPRLFSAASCPIHKASVQEGHGKQLDLLVKVNKGGRFSDIFLKQAKIGTQMRFGLTSPDAWEIIQAQKPAAPLIIIATGSGLGPVRALLQRRVSDLAGATCQVSRSRTMRTHTSGRGLQPPDSSDSSPESSASSTSGSVKGSIPISSCEAEGSTEDESDAGVASRRSSINHQAYLGVQSMRGTINLLAGFKAQDQTLVEKMIRPAKDLGLFDVLELCPSNAHRKRIQDHILNAEILGKLVEKLKDPGCVVFVCANEAAAEGTYANLSHVVGEDIKELLGERYAEEVFRS